VADTPPAPGNPIFDAGPDTPGAGGVPPADSGPSGDQGDQLTGPSGFAPPFDFSNAPAIIEGRAPLIPLPPSGTAPGSGSVSAVPEPGTWAMMILGFLVIGMALRRRGRKQAHPTHADGRPV
jgi:hypothetical protein